MTRIEKSNMTPLKQSIIEAMTEMVGTKVEGAEGHAAQFNYDKDWYSGYNQALADIRSRIPEAAERVAGVVVGEIADLATGPMCLKQRWNCCGFHDACEIIMRKLTADMEEKTLSADPQGPKDSREGR